MIDKKASAATERNVNEATADARIEGVLDSRTTKQGCGF